MKGNTELVLSWLNLSEGGYVNHPDDPGGATNLGVTQRVYSAWLKSRGQPDRDVRHISQAEADRIFKDQYLAPVRFDDLPDGLDYAMADYSVNSGPVTAAKALQRILGVKADGHIGAVTMAALPTAHLELAHLIEKLCNQRMAFLRGLRHWKTFGKGWTKRIEGAEIGYQIHDTGVRDRAVRMALGRELQGRPVAHERAKAPEDKVSPLAAILAALAAIFGQRREA